MYILFWILIVNRIASTESDSDAPNRRYEYATFPVLNYDAILVHLSYLRIEADISDLERRNHDAWVS